MTEVHVAEKLPKWNGWSSGSIDELAAIGTAFVWSLGLEPLPETTASTQINRRTIRYYISSDLMDPPDGERRLAIYRYRHLLQLLYIKARQHAGDRLSEIRNDLSGRTESDLETLVLETLPESVPPPLPEEPGEFARPADLPAILHRWSYLTGRSGRFTTRRSAPVNIDAIGQFEQTGMQMRVEIGIGDGISVTLPANHPLVYDEDGRALILRGIQILLRDYRRGGGPAGKED